MPKMLDTTPNPILPDMLQIPAMNCCKPVIEPELACVLCSEIRPEITGLKIDNHKAIPKEISIIHQKLFSKANIAYKKDINNSTIATKSFLLKFSLQAAVKKLVRYGILMKANKRAI
jgi:hypothetical protein